MTGKRGSRNRAAIAVTIRSRFPADERSHTWYDDTACTPETTALFFNDDRGGEHPERNGQRAKQAIRICRTCSVMDRCLDSALTMRHEPWGVMGGMTPEQLGGLRRKLRHTERTGAAV